MQHLSSTKDSFETLWSAGLGAGLKRVMERGHDDEAASARIPAILEVASAALALETVSEAELKPLLREANNEWSCVSTDCFVFSHVYFFFCSVMLHAWGL